MHNTQTFAVHDAAGKKIAWGIRSRRDAFAVIPPSQAHLYKVLPEEPLRDQVRAVIERAALVRATA